MKYEIKNRFTGNTQFIAEIDFKENESESIKKGLALIWAIKNKANLYRADLRGADLRGANLTKANLTGADLGEANLGGADLGGADLGGADLGEANLGGANLTEANLRWANLRWANLTEANLRWANLRWANLTEANLKGANLDFSCFPLWCGSLKANMDDKQIKQLLYHVLSGAKNSDNVSNEMKKHLLTKKLTKLANESHVVSKHDCEEL